MGRLEDGNQNIPVNAPAGGGGPGRFRNPQPLDVSNLPPGESSRSSLDRMRFTRTILEVEVAIISPWTSSLMVGAELYYRKNLDALQEAVERAIRYAPAAIEEETGQAIKEIIGSILDTLIMSAAIVGATSALGATIGGVVGFFFGGVGALPGAAAGAEAGFDVGMFLLEWLGLAFLLEHVASKLGQMASLVGPNVKLAWDAADKPPAQRARLIDSAAHGLARGIAVLFRLILEGIVMFLLAKGAAKLGELTGKLKASKLGKGFGEWVERNWQKLVDDPRFNPKLKPKEPPKLGGGGGSEGGAPPSTEAPAQPKESNAPASTAARDATLQELAKDPAHGGRITPKSLQEAEVGLSSVESGKIPGPISRDPTGAAEFIDAKGTSWDVKGFNSNFPAEKGGFDLARDSAKVQDEIASGENVIVDTSKMSAQDVESLRADLAAKGLQNNVVWYP